MAAKRPKGKHPKSVSEALNNIFWASGLTRRDRRATSDKVRGKLLFIRRQVHEVNRLLGRLGRSAR